MNTINENSINKRINKLKVLIICNLICSILEALYLIQIFNKGVFNIYENIGIFIGIQLGLGISCFYQICKIKKSI